MMTTAEPVAAAPLSMEAPAIVGIVEPASKKQKIETIETEKLKSEIAEIAEKAENFHNVELEVLWHLGPEQVWWRCTATSNDKQDRKGRTIYTLSYVARPDLDYGEESRNVVFTSTGILRDIAGKTLMQYRKPGDPEPAPLLGSKVPLVVQSEDDAEEWLAATVDKLNEDGTYIVRVRGTKRLTVPLKMMEVVPLPSTLPPTKTLKITDRFFVAVTKHVRELYASKGLTASMTKTFKKQSGLPRVKDKVVAKLNEAIGPMTDIDEFSNAVEGIEIESFYAQNLLEIYDQVEQAAKEKELRQVAAAAAAAAASSAQQANGEEDSATNSGQYYLKENQEDQSERKGHGAGESTDRDDRS